MVKKYKMNKYTILSLLMAIILVFSVYQITDYYVQSNQNKQLNEQLREQFILDEQVTANRQNLNEQRLVQEQDESESVQEEIVQKTVSVPMQASEEEPVIMSKYASLFEINKDILGWIKVDNTVIDYPIVQSEDNDYYLHRNINEKSSSAGSIFMDFRNKGDGTDRHTILFGHHMRDGSMFSDLAKFKEQTFFDSNSTFTFSTLYDETEWEIFSAYVTSTDFYYIVTDFRSNRDYAEFLQTLQDKSMIESNVVLSPDDQIITLSTCTYEFNDARFVVHAKKIQ